MDEYLDIAYALFIPKYAKDGEVGNILRKSYLINQHEYESYFDFVKWFNELDGGEHCVEAYSRLKYNCISKIQYRQCSLVIKCIESDMNISISFIEN